MSCLKLFTLCVRFVPVWRCILQMAHGSRFHAWRWGCTGQFPLWQTRKKRTTRKQLVIHMPSHSKYPLSTTYFLQIYFAQFPDTPKTGTPAGMQHLKHEPIGESDLNCLYLCWVGEPTYSAGKSCMTKLGNVLQNAWPVSPQFSMLWNPGRLNCLNQGKFRRQEDS